MIINDSKTSGRNHYSLQHVWKDIKVPSKSQSTQKEQQRWCILKSDILRDQDLHVMIINDSLKICRMEPLLPVSIKAICI